MTALCQPAPRSVKSRRETAPPRSVDCHFHIFGPDARYPHAAWRGYTPSEAQVPDYEAMIAALGVERMLIVHPSVYGTDNRCSLDSMSALGRERCHMVVLVDERVDDAELQRMDVAGVRGVRFNLVNVGGPSLDALAAVAQGHSGISAAEARTAAEPRNCLKLAAKHRTGERRSRHTVWS